MQQILKSSLQVEEVKFNLQAYKALLHDIKAVPEQALAQISPDDPLALLNPEFNSLAYFYIIAARLSAPDRVDSTANLFPQLYTFIRSFNPAILLVIPPSDIIAFCERIAKKAVNGETVTFVVEILQFACLRFSNISPTAVLLGPFHSEFIRLCLMTRNYTIALPVLEMEITDYSNTYHITAQHFMLYYYYGARIYLGLNRFEKAREFLSMCIVAPAQVVSSIQIEAFKRLMLLDLIKYGAVRSLPKYISITISKSLHYNTQTYGDFCKVFEAGDFDKIQDEFTSCTQFFVNDQCLGLVKQSLIAFYSRKIQKLTQSYLTLSLADIHESLGEKSLSVIGPIEIHLLKMISRGDINATISHQDNGMVHFKETEQEYTADQLEEHTAELMALSQEIEELNRDIGTSKDYLSRNASRNMFSPQLNLDDDEAMGDE